MDYHAKAEVGDWVVRVIVYAMLVAFAGWIWQYAREHFGVLFGKHVNDLSAGGMMVCILFARIAYRCVAHGGADEVPKRGK